MWALERAFGFTAREIQGEHKNTPWFQVIIKNQNLLEYFYKYEIVNKLNINIKI
jgi:hypothetical protein